MVSDALKTAYRDGATARQGTSEKRYNQNKAFQKGGLKPGRIYAFNANLGLPEHSKLQPNEDDTWALSPSDSQVQAHCSVRRLLTANQFLNHPVARNRFRYRQSKPILYPRCPREMW